MPINIFSSNYPVYLTFSSVFKKIIGEKLTTRIIDRRIYRVFLLRLGFQQTLKPRLKKALNSTGIIPISNMNPHRVLIPLIETSHYTYYQILIMAKSFQLRGHEVKLLLCGSGLDGCEIKSVKNTKIDPCLTCRFNKDNIVPIFALDTYVLGDYYTKDDELLIEEEANRIANAYPATEYYYGVEIIRMTNDSVIRHYYGAVPEEANELRRIRKRYLVSAMKGVLVASKIHQSWNPTIIFSHLNVYADWEPYHRFFKEKGAHVSTLSISPFNYNSQLLNYADLFSSSKRFDQWLSTRRSDILSNSEREELMIVLNNRFLGHSEVFKQYDFFDSKNEVSNFLTIDSTKKNIFLFSNVFWDVGIVHDDTLYCDVISWVLDTIEIVSQDSSCHLYIKPHPGEKFDTGATSLKGVLDYVFERYKQLPENVTIVYPEYKINTYHLFPFINLGIVYNGTLGIEMLINDIPVVSCGKGLYTGLGLINEPNSKEDYKHTLLNRREPEPPNKTKVELFAYFYFIKTLIPWKLTKKAYADIFDGYTINSLTELLPENDKYLDHLCNSILEPESTVVENW